MKSYTVEQFFQEEAVQLSLNYEEYEMHRHLHDNLRNVTIPALDKDLEENNNKRDSNERFISIVAGWLTGHIMIVDLAIAGKSRSKWSGFDPFIEESTLLYLIGKMTCISLAKADKNAFQSYIQLSQKYVFRL